MFRFKKQLCKLGNSDGREIHRTHPHKFPRIGFDIIETVFLFQKHIFFQEFQVVFIIEFFVQKSGLSEQQSLNLENIILMLCDDFNGQ